MLVGYAFCLTCGLGGPTDKAGRASSKTIVCATPMR